jgi:hypothetical protein
VDKLLAKYDRRILDYFRFALKKSKTSVTNSHVLNAMQKPNWEVEVLTAFFQISEYPDLLIQPWRGLLTFK